MWKEIRQLFQKETLCDEAFREALAMLEASESMFCDAVASLRSEGALDYAATCSSPADSTAGLDIYERDRLINKSEREIRRKIVTHLAISTSPDANMALVLTAIVIDIERIGDITKNIVELAADIEHAFDGGEIEKDVSAVESTVSRMYETILPALQEGDEEKARQIIEDHKRVTFTVEENLMKLVTGLVLTDNSAVAATATLYLRYLKRISAHLKNIATSIVNPYYRIGFREKTEQME